MTARRRPASVEMPHALADRLGGGDHVGGDVVQSLFGEALHRAGDAERREHFAGVVPDGRRDRIEAVLQFLDLDQFAVLECPEQPERGGLVHTDVGGHFADAGLAAVGEDLQHAHSGRPTAPGPSLRLLLMTQLYELEHLLHLEKRDAHCAVIALTQEDSP